MEIHCHITGICNALMSPSLFSAMILWFFKELLLLFLTTMNFPNLYVTWLIYVLLIYTNYCPEFPFKAPFPQNGDHCETIERPKLGQISLSAVSKTPKKVVSVETLWRSLRDHWGTKNFMEINRDRWVTAEHSLRDQQQPCLLAETIESSLSAHCALSERPAEISERPTKIAERPAEISERLARTNGDHWMTKRVHQKCCVCEKIPERSLKDWWDRWALVERSLSVHWKSASLKDHWETVLNQFKILMETMGTTEFTERSLKNHGRPWRSWSAHWKTVDRSVKWCGLSMCSQRSRLCGKGVLGSVQKWNVR